MNLCVIPARGGSKRIPRKNVREFCGKPMIVWSIEAAKESGLFDRIVVSTDDDEIAQVATKFGAEVPFRRPADLSDDQTATRPVVIHAIESVKKPGQPIDYVCVIYPTAPLIQVSDLQLAFNRIKESDANFAFSVTEYPYPIQRALRLSNDGGVDMFQPKHRLTRSQDLEKAFHDAGQFYWGRSDAFLSNSDTFSSTSIPIVLPSWRVVDIDTQEDWRRAELMFNALRFDTKAAF